MRFDFETIVVGAGIVGSACAFKIAKDVDRRTLLLEQFPLGHALGSSHGGSRIIRCTHSDPIWVPLALDAFREWDRMQQLDSRGAVPLYIKNGLLTMDVDRTQTELRAAHLKRWGVPHEVLRSGKEISRRFPHLQNYGEQWSAIYEPEGGTMLADKCLAAVQRQFLALGSEKAEIRDNEQVLEIVPQKGGKENAFPDEHPLPPFVEVRTTKRTYVARNVVVAAGGWLSRLLPDMPLRSVPHLCGVNFYRVKTRPELFRPELGSPNMTISDENGNELYALPGTDHPGAIKFAIHTGTPIADMARRGQLNTAEWTQTIPAKHLAEHLPDVDSAEPLKRDSCIYTITDDANFLIDVHPVHRNVFVAGGFSGTGFKFALTVGRVMAQWVQGEKEDIDVKPFRLDRHIARAEKAKL